MKEYLEQKEKKIRENLFRESDTFIQYIKTTKNATNHFLPTHSQILILLEGRITFSVGMYQDCTMMAKQILYLLPDYKFTCLSNEDSEIILICLCPKIQFYGNTKIEMLVRSSELAQRNVDLKTLSNAPYLLQMNEILFDFSRNLMLCCEKGIRSKEYFECKERELLYLFEMSFSKKELSLFFEKTSNTDPHFTLFVQQNYYKYQTLSEMAVDMNMTLSGLEKRFKKVFKTSGYRWMNEHKAKKIHQAICTEDIPLKEISMRFGFSSQSTFNDFCKKKLGLTPGQIRKNANG